MVKILPLIQKNMFRFFQSLSHRINSFWDPVSAQLLDILRPDEGAPCDVNESTALMFYQANKNKPVNIYFSKEFYGHTLSILRMCILNKESELLEELFNNRAVKEATYHDFDIVCDSLFSAAHAVHRKKGKKILSLMLEFYKSRVPSVQKEDLTPFILKDHSPNAESLFHYHFNEFPEQELWRLFIDGAKQKKENFWFEYEQREPGFMQAMLAGFKFLQVSISEPLSIDLLKNLHQIATKRVKNLCKECQGGAFRDGTSIGFGLNFNNCNATIAGFLEILESLEFKDKFYSVGDFRLEQNALTALEIEHEVIRIFTEYNKNISYSSKAIARLDCIIKLITDVERIHPFGDGNCRVICILLLNRELIRNGFSPVIMEDPNRFDGYSRDELFCEIVQGMKRFQQVKTGTIRGQLGSNTAELNHLVTQDPQYMRFAEIHYLLNNWKSIDEGQTQQELLLSRAP